MGSSKAALFTRWFIICLCFVLFGCLLSIYLGQDANWDLKNYHIHNAWAFLNERYEKDIFTAGVQTYFHPLLDLPYYLLSNKLLPDFPRIVSFIMGIPYGLCLFLVFIIGWLAAADRFPDKNERSFFCLLCTTFGGTGAITVSEVGTTFNDIPITVLVFLSLLFVLLTQRGISNRMKMLFFSISGVLYGIACALKLTSIFCLPGFLCVLFLLAPHDYWRWKPIILFLLCFLFSFFLVYGPWGLFLYRLTKNPIFPFFNSIFRSDLVPFESFTDKRFLPKGIIEAICYPFFWINRPMKVSEMPFIDLRFPIFFIVLFVRATVSVSQLKKINVLKAACSSSPYLILSFFLASYVTWEYMFSILRYATGLEMMLGILTFSLLMDIPGFTACSRKAGFAFGMIFLLLVLPTTRYPSWGRVPYSEKVFDVRIPKMSDHSLVILCGRPIAYLAPFIHKNCPDSHFIGFTDDLDRLRGRMIVLVEEKIKRWSGSIYYIARKETLDRAKELKSFGLFPSGPCNKITSNIDFGNALYLCPLGRDKTFFRYPSYGRDFNYEIGKSIFFRDSEDGDKHLLYGWSHPESWGIWSNSEYASVLLQLANEPDTPMILELEAKAFVAAEHNKVSVEVFTNGTYLSTLVFQYPDDMNVNIKKIFLPASLLRGSKGSIKIEFQILEPISPAELGVSADHRKLGLGLISMKLAFAH